MRRQRDLATIFPWSISAVATWASCASDAVIAIAANRDGRRARRRDDRPLGSLTTRQPRDGNLSTSTTRWTVSSRGVFAPEQPPHLRRHVYFHLPPHENSEFRTSRRPAASGQAGLRRRHAVGRDAAGRLGARARRLSRPFPQPGRRSRFLPANDDRHLGRLPGFGALRPNLRRPVPVLRGAISLRRRRASHHDRLSPQAGPLRDPRQAAHQTGLQPRDRRTALAGLAGRARFPQAQPEQRHGGRRGKDRRSGIDCQPWHPERAPDRTPGLAVDAGGTSRGQRGRLRAPDRAVLGYRRHAVPGAVRPHRGYRSHRRAGPLRERRRELAQDHRYRLRRSGRIRRRPPQPRHRSVLRVAGRDARELPWWLVRADRSGHPPGFVAAARGLARAAGQHRGYGPRQPEQLPGPRSANRSALVLPLGSRRHVPSVSSGSSARNGPGAHLHRRRRMCPQSGGTEHSRRCRDPAAVSGDHVSDQQRGGPRIQAGREPAGAGRAGEANRRGRGSVRLGAPGARPVERGHRRHVCRRGRADEDVDSGAHRGGARDDPSRGRGVRAGLPGGRRSSLRVPGPGQPPSVRGRPLGSVRQPDGGGGRRGRRGRRRRRDGGRWRRGRASDGERRRRRNGDPSRSAGAEAVILGLLLRAGRPGKWRDQPRSRRRSDARRVLRLVVGRRAHATEAPTTTRGAILA